MTIQINGIPCGDTVVTLTPVVLHGIDEEQHIAINEIIDDTIKLRLIIIIFKGIIRVKVVGIIIVITIVMISVCRYNRHLHNNRLEGLLEPTFPLPFAITITAIFNKVTREDAETCFRYGVNSGRSTKMSIVNINLIH